MAMIAWSLIASALRETNEFHTTKNPGGCLRGFSRRRDRNQWNRP